MWGHLGKLYKSVTFVQVSAFRANPTKQAPQLNFQISFKGRILLSIPSFLTLQFKIFLMVGCLHFHKKLRYAIKLFDASEIFTHRFFSTNYKLIIEKL